MKPIVAIDPGREKCGVAVVEKAKGVLWKKVINTDCVLDEVVGLVDKYSCDALIIGNGTSSDVMLCKLQQRFISNKINIQAVDEYRTTDLAKIRYWQENPPRGWRRLLPTSMQVPPVPVDDYVAVILAERYINTNENNLV